MWSVIDFFKRQRRKLFYAGSIAVGGYLVFKLAKWHMASKAAEFEALLLDEARLEHHFESNQRTCDMTVRSLLPALKQVLYERMDVERLKAQLKSDTSANNRVQVWENMKITALTQLIVAMYSCCFLVVFLRLQLNILGGNMYLDSLNGEEGTEQVNGVNIRVSEGVQREYLNLVHCVLGDGIQLLSQTVRDAVSYAFQPVGLKEQLTLQRLSELLSCACQKAEGKQSKELQPSRRNGLVAIVLPVDHLDTPCPSLSQSEQEMVRSLVAATKDLLENDDFHHVLEQCIVAGFHHIIGTLGQHFLVKEGCASEGSLPLAKILPIVTNTVPVLLDESGEFLQIIMTLPKVQKFAENVYDAFSK
jgi:peroxin-3